MTKVAHVLKVTDADKPTTYVGRMEKGRVTRTGGMGQFGNPFHTGRRDIDIAQFTEYMKLRVIHDPLWRAELLRIRDTTLTCWCHPQPCHADVIARWLNRQPKE